MPGATARRLAAPAVLNCWNASMMPQTVPNKPMNGETPAVVARILMLRSRRVSSSLMPSCKVRSSASGLVTLPRDFIWRATSLYPKSKTATNGERLNCSLAAAMESRAGALRKARRNRRLEHRARRNDAHLERITAQEASEKHSKITITAFGNGPELCTRSQTSNCRNKPPTHESINQAPSGSTRSPYNHDIAPPPFLDLLKNRTTSFCFNSMTQTAADGQSYPSLDEPKPRIISSSVAGNRCRELRRRGARPGEVSRRIEPADGRDRQRQIHCGG